MTRWIFIAGMRRSGSTLTYHVTREILRSRVDFVDLNWVAPHKLSELWRYNYAGMTVLAKTHICPRGRVDIYGDVYCIQSHRNLLDVMASQMVMYSKKRWIVDDFNGNAAATVGEFLGWEGFGNLIQLRYADFVLDIASMANDVAKFLGMPINKSEASDIASTFSITNQKDRLPAEGYDAESAMHHNHINNGSNGYYQSVLTEWQIGAVKSIGEDYMRIYGYR